jgi:UDP-GlcNAc3NAcA epimerase
MTVVGARPQFVKAAVVSEELRRRGNVLEELVHTGQHFDDGMSAVFFRQLGIPEPAWNLGIHSLGHGAMTGRMLEAIEGLIRHADPGAVLVYGDTNSTLAGALAARKLDRIVVHVEAGLRSRNRQMPEEVNRVIVDRISDVLCCPTRTAVENLLTEGYDRLPCRVVNTGDVMLDAVQRFRDSGQTSLDEALPELRPPFAVCTLHRAENTDRPGRLQRILRGLEAVASELPVILPAHPRTAPLLRRTTGVRVVAPLPYLEMLALTARAAIVLTDSGGLQKEAFFLGVPCVTLRDETEWNELVDSGCNIVAGADTAAIVAAVARLLATPLNFDPLPFGRGDASQRVVDAVEDALEAR